MSQSQTTAAAVDPAAKRSVRDLVRAAVSGWLGTASAASACTWFGRSSR